MRTSDSSMVAARQSPRLISRDFVSIAGRDRTTGEIAWLHVFNDIGVVDAPVLDLDTGEAVELTFVGDGALVDCAPVEMVCEQKITERSWTCALNPHMAVVNDFLRSHDLHEQPVRYYQGDFNPATNKLVAPAECVFEGYVDTAPMVEGEDGGVSSAEINCRSAITEMTRTNSLKRSHASEILRDPNDEFFLDTGVVGEWQTYLGQEAPKAMKNV